MAPFISDMLIKFDGKYPESVAGQLPQEEDNRIQAFKEKNMKANGEQAQAKSLDEAQSIFRESETKLIGTRKPLQFYMHKPHH